MFGRMSEGSFQAEVQLNLTPISKRKLHSLLGKYLILHEKIPS